MQITAEAVRRVGVEDIREIIPGTQTTAVCPPSSPGAASAHF